MATDANGKSYEDLRNQRVLDNQKRMEELGIVMMSKSVCNLKNTDKSWGQRNGAKRLRDSSDETPFEDESLETNTAFHNSVDEMQNKRKGAIKRPQTEAGSNALTKTNMCNRNLRQRTTSSRLRDDDEEDLLDEESVQPHNTSHVEAPKKKKCQGQAKILRLDEG